MFNFNTSVAVEFAWPFVCISTVPVSFILLLILSLGVNIIMNDTITVLVLLPLILFHSAVFMHFAPNIFIKKGNWITLTAHSDKEHETQEHWEKLKLQ